METLRKLIEIAPCLLFVVALGAALILPMFPARRMARQDKEDERWLAEHIHEATNPTGRIEGR